MLLYTKFFGLGAAKTQDAFDGGADIIEGIGGKIQDPYDIGGVFGHQTIFLFGFPELFLGSFSLPEFHAVASIGKPQLMGFVSDGIIGP